MSTAAHALIHPSCWHPGASASCAACGGCGWVLVADAPTLALEACACAGVCPTCEGAGVLHGGLTRCGCAVVRGRASALQASGLPALPRGWHHAAPPPALTAWCDRYRPEDGWPWLTVIGPDDAPVIASIARLITAAEVPVHLAHPQDRAPERATWRRLVVALDLARWTPSDAARMIDHCRAHGLTLLASARHQPFPDHAEGLEAHIGEDATIALIELGEVITST